MNDEKFISVQKFARQSELAVKSFGSGMANFIVRLAGTQMKVCTGCGLELHESHFRILDDCSFSKQCMICETTKFKGMRPLTKEERKYALRHGYNARAAYDSKRQAKAGKRRVTTKSVRAAFPAFEQETKRLAEAMAKKSNRR